MKNDLTCGVVRDLLPSYVEGLLGAESQEAVERHLEGCPDCAARWDAMTAPTGEPQKSVEELDFLKQVKRENHRRVIVSVLATFVGLLAAALLKTFVIGTPMQASSVYCDALEEDGVLHLSVMSIGSSDALHGWKVEIEDGAACVYARRVLVSGLFPDGSGTVDIPLNGVDEVWVGGKSGKLVWQDGVSISRLALELLDARTPYCGDPTALGRIAEILSLQERLGSYTISMQTSKRPYHWELEFANNLNEEQRKYMARAEYLMLALVDNLDEVRFTYPSPEMPEGYPAELSMTLDAAAEDIKNLTEKYNQEHFKTQSQRYWTPKDSVKDYVRTPADFQRLLNILEMP